MSMVQANTQYAPYPTYKDTNVEWLGEIPAHWNLLALKYAAYINAEVLPETTAPDYELQYVDISNVDSQGNVIEVQPVYFENAPSRARRRVKDGDTIISTVRTYLKAVAYIKNPPENLIVSTGFAVLSPKPKILPEYLRWLVLSEQFISLVVAHSVGVSYPAINPTTLGSLPIWLPPLEEQRAIATILDHEVNQINELIAQKHRLIHLLRERFSSLTSQVVVRGLDPSIPMCDSGIDWLGEIPCHWKLKRFKFLMHKIEQGWSPLSENHPAENDEWAVLKVGCVNGGKFNANENKALPPELEPLTEYEIKTGDLLISRANTRELLGSAAVVKQVRSKLLLCDKLYRVRLDQNQVDADFLVAALSSSSIRYQFERDATGASSSMQNIGQDSIKEAIIVLPGLEEQVQIREFLSGLNDRIGRIVTALEQSISNLSEQRSALISAAVTGKIDVRGEI